MREMMEIREKLNGLRADIHAPIANISTICDSNDIDTAASAVFDTVLNWMKENIEEIKFK